MRRANFIDELCDNNDHLSMEKETNQKEIVEFKSFQEFYQFYLGEHKLPLTKLFHCVGTTLGLICLGMAFKTRDFRFIFLGVFVGYLFPWISHFLIEKNRPATFKYPFYSFISDFRMFFEIITFRRKLSD